MLQYNRTDLRYCTELCCAVSELFSFSISHNDDEVAELLPFFCASPPDSDEDVHRIPNLPPRVPIEPLRAEFGASPSPRRPIMEASTEYKWAASKTFTSLGCLGAKGRVLL
jgi:hypothetical protein